VPGTLTAVDATSARARRLMRSDTRESRIVLHGNGASSPLE
jgi:hypothetical protein